MLYDWTWQQQFSKLVFTIERINNRYCVIIYVDHVEFLLTNTETNGMENGELSTGHWVLIDYPHFNDIICIHKTTSKFHVRIREERFRSYSRN